ncbi:MAG: glycosyl hydrolase family protein [Sphingobacteriales bacterium]|nr:MAG: glycosyl hydrolase family protein [Sphingobacteriales bacterium]
MILIYKEIINYCLELGIEPWVTLYHWDLPQKLEEHGGWTNRRIINWFENYTEVCVHHFGDRVKNWMVANEPLAFTGAGYFLGVHAPGRRGLKNFLPAMHHAILAIAQSARAIRNSEFELRVGTTFSCSLIEPASSSSWDIKAAERIDALMNRLFIEPLTGSGYPVRTLKFLRKLEKYILPGDKELMHFEWDFIGLQNYTREIVRHSFLTPYLQAALVPARKRRVPTTAMGWEVYPAALSQMIRKFQPYTLRADLIITENGAAFQDVVSESDQIDDTLRTAFIEQSLKEVLKAKQAGLKVDGYFVWSLTDNFEWIEGYNPRFGLVHIDFETQKRRIKQSGHWYKNFLKKASDHTPSP